MRHKSRPTAAEIATYAAAIGCSEGWARDILTKVAEPLRERIIRAAVLQRPTEGEMLHDPIEDEPQMAAVLAQAEAQAEVGVPSAAKEKMGYCHVLWQRKAEILRSRFGVVWYSPADMNPYVLID